MDLSPNTGSFIDGTRRDGWLPELKGRFLAILAESKNTTLALRRRGQAGQTTYVQRRRDARSWAVTMRQGRGDE